MKRSVYLRRYTHPRWEPLQPNTIRTIQMSLSFESAERYENILSILCNLSRMPFFSVLLKKYPGPLAARNSG